MHRIDMRARREMLCPLRRPHRTRCRLGFGLAAALVGALAAVSPAAAAVRSVGGGAYALHASVNALVAPVSVGALPSVSLPPDGGGPYTESLASANAIGLAPVRLASVGTEGNSAIGSASSFATVADVGIAGLVTVSAARSRCSVTAGGADGSASVVDLVVAGIRVSTVNAGPNTTIALPVGTVILNEQRRSGASGLTVNAIRVSLDAAVVSGDIVIAQSRCTVSSTSARGKGPRRVKRLRHS